MKRASFVIGVAVVAACATVDPNDTGAWVGQPVSALDAHPLFLTMPVEVRNLPDGTEVRNYVNGKDIGRCFGGSSANVVGRSMIHTSGSAFCSTSFAACNNIFYIKNGTVQQYTPVGSGGAKCFTDASTRPTGWKGRQLNR